MSPSGGNVPTTSRTRKIPLTPSLRGLRSTDFHLIDRIELNRQRPRHLWAATCKCKAWVAGCNSKQIIIKMVARE
jgi:hypothetical protein